MSGRDEFCEHCDIALDLHPDGQNDEQWWCCDAAEQRATLVERFFQIGARS